MNENSCTTLEKINTVIHWYQLWSPRQRQEFLIEMANNYLPNKIDILLGAIANMKVNDATSDVFVFQLRMVGQWLKRWSKAEQDCLIERLNSFDPDFYQRLQRFTQS